MKKSKRGNVDPFIVMDVMENARKAEERGEDIVHMEVGQPGTPAPIDAQKELIKIMKNDSLGYTVALGIPELRQRISQLYGDWYNLDLNPNRIIITSGSSAGFILSFSSLFDAKDRVGICSPGYPSYRQILKAQDLDPVLIETKFENNFQPFSKDLKDINLSGVLMASPANPTGSMLNYNQLESLINTEVNSSKIKLCNYLSNFDNDKFLIFLSLFKTILIFLNKIKSEITSSNNFISLKIKNLENV